MTRFSPDSDVLDGMIHAIYRYKTGEVDQEGNPVYRPIAFQNDAEDITLIYDDFSLSQFDTSDEVAAKAAFVDAVRNFDDHITADVAERRMDLFQLLERVVNYLHVNSKMAVNSYEVPTKLSQLQNDAGYAKTTDTVDRASVANTADALTNTVKIKLGGHAAGSANFKGNQDVTISVSGVKATSDVDGNAIKTTYAKKDELPSTMTSADLDAGTDDTAKIISAQTLKTFVTGSIDAANTGVRSVVTGTSNGTIRVNTGGTTTNVLVKGLGSAAYTASTAYAPASHTHVSSDVTKMSGYSIATSYTAITTTDSLNAAIGKLEKHFDDKLGKLETAVRATADANGNTINTTYATKSEVSTIPKFKISVVGSLPATGDTATIYLVRDSSSSGNMYTEYIYVNSEWELLGGQDVDLDGYLKANQITTGSGNGSISVAGTDIAVKGLGTAAYKADSYFSKVGHTHVSNEITKMTGYTKQDSYSPITANDSLNVAIGKLEKHFDIGGTADDANALGGYPASDYVRAVQITSGSANGKISVQGQGVAVYGLKSAAYTDSSEYLAYNGTAADSTKLGGVAASNYVKTSDITTGTANGTFKVGSTAISIYGLKSAAYKDADYFSPSTHGHDVMTGATAEAAGAIGFVPKPAKGKQASFLRGDATWAVPVDTKYSNFVKSGSTAAAGLVPAPSTTPGTTKYLREDATWQVPPNDNTDTKVTINVVAPTASTSYYMLGIDGTSTKTSEVYSTSSIRFQKLTGTVDEEGLDTIILGNGTVSGAAGNQSGRVMLYNNKGKYTYLRPHIDDTSNRIIYLPKSGTTSVPATLVAHTTDTAIGGSTQPVYINANGVATAIGYTISANVPSDAVFTDHTYSNFIKSGSTAAAGLVPKPSTTPGTTKYLREDATWQVPPGTYEHPTTAGNKHIPTSGASNKVLVYGGSSGTAAWSDWCIWVTDT